MEVIGAISTVVGCLKKVTDLLEKNTERAVVLKLNLNTIARELKAITDVPMEKKQLQLPPRLQLQLQELAYDIDDFVQGLWDPGEVGSFILSAIGADPRLETTKTTDDFKVRIEKLKLELSDCSKGTSSGETSAPADPSSSAGSSISYDSEVDLVGIKGPKKEIEELLSPRVEPHRGTLGVIAIVGRSGSGKTALARALYEDDAVTKDFDFKAWVVACDTSSADIVNKIRQAMVPSSPEEAFPKDKRYLVVVDDVQRDKICENIKYAFDGNVMDSRIIVTTRLPFIAKNCSSGSFVYAMQGLDKENARELFRRKFRGKDGYSEEDKYRLGGEDVDYVVDKCDGLPAALISGAECLRGKNIKNPVTEHFQKVSQELGQNLACSESNFELYKKIFHEGETTFVEMRRALVEPYENLLGNGDKACLLYVSIFPSGHQINSNSLVRRLEAEGLDPGNTDIERGPASAGMSVRDCLNTLIGHLMIEPLPVHRNSAGKRCRVHGIMREFTLEKALSRNLVSLIHNGNGQYNRRGEVRRLTVQSSPRVGLTGPPSGIGLSVVRSLAIFKSGILKFQECKLVRVLDLEDCHGLTSEVLGNICGLRFLKYLCLRNTDISELPQNMEKLMFLETLDIRDTRDTRDTVVLKLPVEVIMLPRFANLFGKFELTNVHNNNMEKVTRFFSKGKSQLHTLGGIAVHEEKGLEIALLAVKHATKLTKVKVWYRNTPSSTGPVNTSTPAACGTPEVTSCDSRRELLTHKSVGRQGFHKLTRVLSKRKPSAGPLAESSSSAQDPVPATSTPVANGTLEPILSASRRGFLKHMMNPVRLLSKRKPSAEPSTDPSSSTPGPATATTTPIASGTPGHPSAGPSADSSGNTPDPAPATSRPLASDTPELIHCVSILTEALKNNRITLESLSIDFNGVTNTLLDFHQISGTLSSIKLRGGQGSLPGPDKLRAVCNLRKLHLFSTGLKSDELAALQHLNCLQHLKLVEDGHGLWDSEFHVQDGGFKSLISLCFEGPNLPPIKIDKGAMTVLASLQVLCPVGHVVTDIAHLAKLDEVMLHPSASEDEVAAWKEEAKRHINRPYVEKKQD